MPIPSTPIICPSLALSPAHKGRRAGLTVYAVLKDCLDRHYLFWVGKAIDPFSPMLHQLRARADQGKRSVPLVDRLHRVAFKMRQLQFDDIAIPHLGFLDLLMMAESR